MTEFLRGFLAPIYGIRLLAVEGHLRALAIIPFVISLVLGSFLTVAGLYGLSLIIGSVSFELGALLQIAPGSLASEVLTFVLWPFGLLVLGVAIYLAIRIVAAPFYSYLAEKVLVKLGARRDGPFVLRRWVRLTWHMLVASVAKSFLFGLASVVMLVVSLIPGLNILATIGFVFMLAFDVSDYAFEAMEWSLAKRLQHVRENMLTYIGLACSMGLVMTIPGLNLLLLPALVTGASETLYRTLRA